VDKKNSNVKEIELSISCEEDSNKEIIKTIFCFYRDHHHNEEYYEDDNDDNIKEKIEHKKILLLHILLHIIIINFQYKDNNIKNGNTNYRDDSKNTISITVMEQMILDLNFVIIIGKIKTDFKNRRSKLF